ncbi:MAG TPA: ATP-dependent Clp protease proteolytic subunit [Clostridia bacterium]|jgi:ATP-dependent Clp protease protease subunit|nr:ATP-dependent Clp protease proteolytic subunit [Clostridia bacterium]
MKEVTNYTPIPTVIEQTSQGPRAHDLYSRLMEDRIVFVSGGIDSNMANIVVGQLLFLEMKDPTKDISLYINSPGGEVSAGLAILDTMNYIKCDVKTICIGMAASMGAILLSAGAKGKRYALPNSLVMIHQPLGAASGQATDVIIAAERLAKTKEKINEILSENTGQPMEVIRTDTERDKYLTALEAKEYGIIDEVFFSRKSEK